MGRISVGCLHCLLGLATSVASADGSIVDKVYHPYVQLLEKEIEHRVLYQQDSQREQDGRYRYKLGYGQSLSDQLFAEFYVTGAEGWGEEGRDDSLELEAYEVELKWQLTEQGEYDNDWGLQFELEKERGVSVWEASTTLIALHEWRDWLATGNLSLIYEWGNDINNEWETAFSGQLRYRFNAMFEPGIELYQSQDTQGIGPVMTGVLRLGAGNKLIWDVGAIVGTDSTTADISWKLNIEYEFQ